MTFSTSEVAVCCSSASFSSRVRALICSCGPAAERLRRCAVFGALWRCNVLGRCVFPSLLPVLLRRLIASPEAQDKASYRFKSSSVREGPMSALGQKQTFAVQYAMSALPPIADMCGALADVRFVPIADIGRLYSITSFARSRNASGIVKPSALAVVRLTTRSNLVGCSTGRSAGFAPCRILSTYSAARRNRSGKFGP